MPASCRSARNLYMLPGSAAKNGPRAFRTLSFPVGKRIKSLTKMTADLLSVRLNGGGPWGFRLRGGLGTGMPLVVAKVRRKSKSYKRLFEGDMIVNVNGRPCEDLSYDQVMEIAEANTGQLTLQILRPDSNKENQAPDQREKIPESFSESTSKAREEDKHVDEATTEQRIDTFPSFTDLLNSPAQDTSQLKENTVEKKPEESSNITSDTMDLNNLIAATQKKLDTLKSDMTWASDPASHLQTSLKEKETPPKIRPLSYPCMTDLKRELDASLGSLTSSSLDFSCFESPFGTTIATKKKKMFSSSSFYEEPHSIYPTVEEQVEMAKKIADSLADDTNKKSKGANMFYKRVKKSTKWVHEGPEGSEEMLERVPWKTHKGISNLKLVLDPRHTQDASTLRSSGVSISEHNVVSPEVCHDLVKDLHSPVGKGAALFAKRKKKSEEWVVDEEKVHALLREKYSLPRQGAKLWGVHPEELADTVIRAADSKRCLSPPAATYSYQAPRGWTTNTILEPAAALQADFLTGKKRTFQNFNTVPRLWKKASTS